MDATTRAPRLRKPDRFAVVPEVVLDDLLPPDHQARAVVGYVATLDLSGFLVGVRAVEGTVGRNATDPAALLSLWILATLEGVASARRLEKLILEHAAYRWIAGGLTFCHRLLSSFRSSNAELFEELVTTHVAALMSEGLVRLDCVAQDGMRVRAWAGEDTFRREPTIEEAQRLLREQLDQLRRQEDEDADAPERRARAAAARRAEERLKRLERAKKAAEDLTQARVKRMKDHPAEAKQRGATGEGRASTTDPDARQMKMPGGGFRPGYNVQAATTAGTGIVVAFDVAAKGADGGLLSPMLDRIEESYGKRPDSALVDGGYASAADVEEAHAAGVAVYAPLKNEKKDLEQGKDPYAAKKSDGPGVAAQRERMGSVEGKATYRLRAQTAEWTNAGMRQRGLYQVNVRGLEKVRSVVGLHVLVHNLRQAALLRARAAAE